MSTAPEPLMPEPQPGFAPAPVNSTQWNAQVVQANAQAQQAAMQQRQAQAGGGPMDMIPDFIKYPVEAFGSALHTAYTNVISRPLSTLFLASYIGSAESKDAWGSWSNLFDGDIWDRAYQDSKHVSPGQAIGFGISNLFDSHDEFKKAMQQQVEGKVVDPTTGQTNTVNLNQNKLLWDNPDAVKTYFDHGTQKWLSGGIDAAVNWYADPTVLAGKGLGAFRQAVYVRPAVSTDLGTFRGAALEKLTGGAIKNRTTQVNIEDNLNSSAFNSMGDLIMKYKDQDPSTFSSWASNQAWARNASDSGALIAALSKAADRDQVNDVLAVSIGDMSAVNRLSNKNAELAAQLQSLKLRQQGAVASFPYGMNPEQAAQFNAQMNIYADQMSAIEKQQGGIMDTLKLQDSMKNGMYYTPGLSPLASNFGQYVRGLWADTAKNAYQRGGLTLAAAHLVYNNLYIRPLRVISGTTADGIRSPGWIDLDANDAHRAFQASLEQANVWAPSEIAQQVSSFIDAAPQAKNLILQQADAQTVARIAAKNGVSPQAAAQLYTTLGGMKAQAMGGRIYSTATIDDGMGGVIRADHVADDGSMVAASPLLSTQLQNTQILTDYEHMNRVLKVAGPAFNRLYNDAAMRATAEAGGPITQAAAQAAAREAMGEVSTSLAAKRIAARGFGADATDAMNKIWKFNVLLRLGYGPRAISDDFMGQAARLGAYNFIAERMLAGGRGQFMRTWNRVTGDPTGFEQMKASMQSGMDSLTEDIAGHQKDLDDLLARNADPRDIVAKRQQMEQAQDTLNQLRDTWNKMGAASSKLGDKYVIMPDGTAFARPFEGPQGAMFRDLNAGRRTIDSMMGGTANSIWNKMRSGDWTTRSIADGDKFYDAWLKDVQYQIANDPAAMAAVNGGKQGVLNFFASQAGRDYRRSGPWANMSADEHADRIAAHIDHYLPTGSPAAGAVRQAVVNGADDDTVLDLMRKVETGQVPTSVQSEGLKYALGKGDTFNAVNTIMDKFYKILNQMPSEALSRNPLFFSLYRQHTSEMWAARQAQGVESLSAREMQQIEGQARQLALKDVKRFTFNMDYESKVAHSMRFMTGFFGPMEESFKRWGRIVADRPEVVSKAAQIYTAPIRNGHAVDKDGQPVDEDGYAIDKQTGERYLVPKDEMHIQYQMPTWMSKAAGQYDGSLIDMPINTLNLVLQNDPWFNPGTGPWVQVPANAFAMKSDPEWGDIFKKLGILQQVTPDMKGQLLGSFPKTLSELLGGKDTDQEQKDFIQIMQAEDYKWRMGMRDTQPSYQEIRDKADYHSYFKGFLKAVMPFSSTFKDPYQFFRDRYQELQQADSKTADQVFLAKYGDAAFAFTGALTKSKTGVPATREGVLASQKYADILATDPDAAKLLLSPYSAGEFSQTALAQQQARGERVTMDPVESMKQARVNAGYAEYGKVMNVLTANLYQAGFQTFQDRGAEQFDNMRKGLIKVLTTSHLPDGSVNKLYNEDFANAFLSQDKNKEQRMADAMNLLVTDKDLMSDPMRDDIKGLAQYMTWRNSAQQVLSARKAAGGSGDINSNSNTDIKFTLHNVFNQLVESNTQFQALHDRFLSRDMFDHYGLEFGQEQQQQ